MNTKSDGQILKEVLGKQAPVVVCRSTDEQKKVLATLKEGLKGLKTISLESNRGYYYPRGEPGPELDFSINYPGDYRAHSYAAFTVCFNDQHVLCLKRSYPNTEYHLCGEIHQLETLVDRLLIEAEKRENKQIKAKKVKDLKTAAIMARIREMAVADEFDFHCRHQDRKIKLVVRIEKNGYLEIDIPFGQFQEKLQRIRDCIRLAREISDLKVVRTIKYMGVQGGKWHWTSYRNLKNSKST